jgi:type I restriction enzyme, S subunit
MELATLNQYVTYFKGFAFKSEWYTKEGFPIIKVSDFIADGIDAVNLSKIKSEIAKDYTKYAIRSGDIIIQTVGSWPDNPNSVVGKVVRANEKVNGALLNQNAVNLIPNNTIDRGFLFYLLKSELFKGYIINTAQGAANQASITLDSILNYKFYLPPLSIQQRIASILSAYDDLIEVNNQRIKLLEETASQLYKEWFVRMRFPGYKKAKFEKGIPTDWKVVRIDSIYKTSSGGTPSREKTEYFENGIHDWIKTGELLDSFILNTEEKISDLGLKCSSAKLFPPYTTIFAMYGNTIGQLGITTQPSATNQACCALLPLTKEFDFEFIFLTLLQNRTEIISYGMGAAQQNVNQDEIKKFKILKPTNQLAMRFKELVNPMFLQIETLQQQNTHLRQIRDRLLPRLISGKLEVKEPKLNSYKNDIGLSMAAEPEALINKT